MGVFHWLWPSPLQQVSTTVLPVMTGFWGCRIQICYLNFSGRKERCHGNQISKNKPKLHKFHFSIKYWEIVHVNSRVLGIREFTYIIGIFKGSKRVTMATEFKQTSAKTAPISVLCKKSRNFNYDQYGFWGPRIKVCYQNFQWSKQPCHDNHI